MDPRYRGSEMLAEVMAPATPPVFVKKPCVAIKWLMIKGRSRETFAGLLREVFGIDARQTAMEPLSPGQALLYDPPRGRITLEGASRAARPRPVRAQQAPPRSKPPTAGTVVPPAAGGFGRGPSVDPFAAADPVMPPVGGGYGAQDGDEGLRWMSPPQEPIALDEVRMDTGPPPLTDDVVAPPVHGGFAFSTSGDGDPFDVPAPPAEASRGTDRFGRAATGEFPSRATDPFSEVQLGDFPSPATDPFGAGAPDSGDEVGGFVDPFAAGGGVPDPFAAGGGVPDPFAAGGGVPDPFAGGGRVPDPFAAGGGVPDPFAGGEARPSAPGAPAPRTAAFARVGPVVDPFAGAPLPGPPPEGDAGARRAPTGQQAQPSARERAEQRRRQMKSNFGLQTDAAEVVSEATHTRLQAVDGSEVEETRNAAGHRIIGRIGPRSRPIYKTATANSQFKDNKVAHPMQFGWVGDRFVLFVMRGMNAPQIGEKIEVGVPAKPFSDGECWITGNVSQLTFDDEHNATKIEVDITGPDGNVPAMYRRLVSHAKSLAG
jgi:formin 2